MAKDAKVVARTKRASKKSAAKVPKMKPGRSVAVAKPPVTPKILPQLMTTDEAIEELTGLKLRFRNTSAEHHRELLHAEWETAEFYRVKEGDLWLPSPSEANVMLQGFVYLKDHYEFNCLKDDNDQSMIVYRTAYLAGKPALYSPVTKAAAGAFRLLAAEGGGIITRIPQLEFALKKIVCGESAGNDIEYERWWFGFLFAHVASVPLRDECDMGQQDQKTKQWSKGPTHGVEIIKLFRESERACEILIELLKSGRKLVCIPSDWKGKFEFRKCRHHYSPVAEVPKRALDELLKVELRDIPHFMGRVFGSAESTERVRAAIHAWSRDYQTAMTIIDLRNKKRRLNKAQKAFIAQRERSSLTAWLLIAAPLIASLRDQLVLTAAIYDATTSAEPKFNPWWSEPDSEPECWSLLSDQIRKLSESEVKWLQQAFDGVCDHLNLHATRATQADNRAVTIKDADDEKKWIGWVLTKVVRPLFIAKKVGVSDRAWSDFATQQRKEGLIQNHPIRKAKELKIHVDVFSKCGVSLPASSSTT